MIVLTFSYICCFGNVSQKDGNSVQRIVNISNKITGFKQFILTGVHSENEKQVLRKATRIINDNIHCLHNEYMLLPSSRRFRIITSNPTLGNV